MREVVSRVHADISYQIQDGLRRNELFTRSPIAVRFIDATPERSVAFTVIPKNEKEVLLSQLTGDDTDKVLTVMMNDTVAIGDLHIVVTPTHFYKGAWLGKSIQVQKNLWMQLLLIIRQHWASGRKNLKHPFSLFP